MSSPNDHVYHLSRRWIRRLPWLGLLLAAIVLGLYLSRLTALGVRGEESRRARIAVEMMESGDWVVPRQQGSPLLSRPPLQNWVIAAFGAARGDVDLVAIRLPSVLAVLMTSLVIYGYGRTFLSRTAALTAGLAFATMGQVLELGRLGETEAVFTFLVSGSLLVWHWGFSRGWPPLWAWTSAYALVALGILAKGPQAPVYFAVSVGTYLMVTGRWRDALTPSHMAGIALLVVLWGAWQVPFFRATDWQSVRMIFGGDVALRFADTSWSTIASHLALYPFEVFCCTLPWSLFLLAYVRQDFRQSLSLGRDNALYLAICIAVTFPTCWLPPGARGRYYMPLFPCLALLAGLVVDRLLLAEDRQPWRRFWQQFFVILAGLTLSSGLVIAAASAGWLPFEALTLPSRVAVWFAVGTLVLTPVMIWARDGRSRVRIATGIVAAALLVGFVWLGPIIEGKRRPSETSTPTAIAALKQRLPSGTRLASLGPTDHLFAYYYREPIKQLPWPLAEQSVPADVEYFCYSTNFCLGPPLDQIPFPYETLAVIACDARHVEPTERFVLVGRRLDESATAVRTASRAGSQ